MGAVMTQEAHWWPFEIGDRVEIEITGRGAAMREFSVEVTVRFQRPIGNSR